MCGGHWVDQTRFKDKTWPFLVLISTGLIFTGSVQVSGAPSNVNIRFKDWYTPTETHAYD